MAKPGWVLEGQQIHEPGRNGEKKGAGGLCLEGHSLSGETEKRGTGDRAEGGGGSHN